MNSKYRITIPPNGALLTTFPGETSMATLEQVRAFAQGSSARIQR